MQRGQGRPQCLWARPSCLCLKLVVGHRPRPGSWLSLNFPICRPEMGVGGGPQLDARSPQVSRPGLQLCGGSGSGPRLLSTLEEAQDHSAEGPGSSPDSWAGLVTPRTLLAHPTQSLSSPSETAPLCCPLVANVTHGSPI